MAKQIRLEPVKISTGKWRLNVPAAVSPSGKRQRLFFESERLAKLEAHRLRDMAGRWGSEGRKIPATLAQDAAKAAEILKGEEVSLTMLARRYVEQKAKQEASVTFSELWQAFEESRELKSDSHRRAITNIGNKLEVHIGDLLVCDITGPSLSAAIRAEFPTAHGFNLAVRTASPAFNMAIKRGWATANPCAAIDKVDTRRRAVSVLSLNEARKLMSAAKDYRKVEAMPELLRVDCRGSEAALAVMLFAGVRPTEATRLDWQDIDLEEGTILVSNLKAKTDRSRYFQMPATLRSWLEAFPPTERIGPIVPAGWRRKWQAIRKAVGIDEERDQLRKSFASYHLAHYAKVNLTRSIMGHESGDVLFQHYRGIVKPKDAAAFWEILPGGDVVNFEKKMA